MKAYQIFQAISPELGRTLFQDLRDGHRDAYKGVLVSLAGKRRLRPVFVQRKPASQQIEWLYKTCQLRPVDEVAANMLQVWLLRARKDMLILFLDELGIEHDGEGTAEDLPDELDTKKLRCAVDAMLQRFPAEQVALYLHVFQFQQPGGWEALKELFAADARVSLSVPGVVPEGEKGPDSEENSESLPASAGGGGEEEAVEEVREATGEEVVEAPKPAKKAASRKKAAKKEVSPGGDAESSGGVGRKLLAAEPDAPEAVR